LYDVEEICDEVGVINGGKLLYAGKVSEFCRGKSLEERFVEMVSKEERAGRLPDLLPAEARDQVART